MAEEFKLEIHYTVLTQSADKLTVEVNKVFQIPVTDDGEVVNLMDYSEQVTDKTE